MGVFTPTVEEQKKANKFLLALIAVTFGLWVLKSSFMPEERKQNSPSTTPAPVTSLPAVTLKQFNEITEGMTGSDLFRILGRKPDDMKNTQRAMFQTWRNEDGSSLVIVVRAGLVSSKYNNGLK